MQPRTSRLYNATGIPPRSPITRAIGVLGAVREGMALLQGLAVCGHCGRRLRTHYRGRNSTPGYHCAGKDIVQGCGVYCLNVGGIAIDHAVAQAFVEAVSPAALDATLITVQQFQAHMMRHWRSGGSPSNGRATTPNAPSAVKRS